MSVVQTDTPPENLSYPESAKITALELMTFLPHSLKADRAVYRLVSNGATCAVLCAIVNHNRNFTKPSWNGDFISHTMYQTMRRAGHQGWTVTKHPQFHQANVENWDEGDLGVVGFKVTGKGIPGPGQIQNIPFSHLAHNIKHFPEGDDALDLTRMIRHAVEHPEQGWLYPKHYDELLAAIGGPKEIKPANFDRAVFNRWAKVEAPRRIRHGTPKPTEMRTSSTPVPQENGKVVTITTQANGNSHKINSRKPDQNAPLQSGSVGGHLEAASSHKAKPRSSLRKDERVNPVIRLIPYHYSHVGSDLQNSEQMFRSLGLPSPPPPGETFFEVTRARNLECSVPIPPILPMELSENTVLEVPEMPCSFLARY